jgi:hypothetical protein
MKTLCPKGGKIHPSPVEDPVRAAFRLLPAAILVLVAGLGPEDREVLAYLVTVPVEDGLAREPAVPLSEKQAPARRRVGDTSAAWAVGHPPTHGCGCVDCYMSFWARWNRSPERDRIQDALQAFEEHLAAPPSSSRRRGRRGRLPATPPPPMPLRRPEPRQVVEAVQVPDPPLPPSFLPPPPFTAEEEEVVPEPAAAAEPEAECREVAAGSAVEGRKRGWAGVMGGVLGLRLWGIWSPPVESAT